MTIEPGSTSRDRIDVNGERHLQLRVPDEPARDWLEPPAGWTDTLTAMDGPIYWARLTSTEGARIRRYGRPATVVVLEAVGLDALRELWGPDVAIECLNQIAATITKQIRSSDAAARIGSAQFGVYLPETNEIDAINFVERTRAAIVQALGRKADTVTVAIGWASPLNGSLDEAIGIAEARLTREARTAGAA